MNKKMRSVMNANLSIYSDGASRGNPGPAATAFLFVGESGEILKRYSEHVGVKTNNQAEYEALIQALESAQKLTRGEVVCHLDSELIVRHLNRDYRVRDAKLKPLWLKVDELARQFHCVTFVHVPRTNFFIQEVDRMANETLDRFTASL